MKSGMIGLTVLAMMLTPCLVSRAMAGHGNAPGLSATLPDSMAGPSSKGHGKGHAEEMGPSKEDREDRIERSATDDDEALEERGERHSRKHRGRFFRNTDARHFRDCYPADDYENLPPGLRKHVERTGHLPPGLEMQLERNGHLPPGLEKRLEPASSCMVARLGRRPPHTGLYRAGRDLILLDDRTREIVDILRGP